MSCKRCADSLLYRNDGTGTFEQHPRALSQYTNNYEFEAMNLGEDDFLDLVTINDAAPAGANACSGTMARAGSCATDDNGVAFLAYDADFRIASLSGPGRLLINDGTGLFTDATADHLPATLVRFSWDLELVDSDNHFGLDGDGERLGDAPRQRWLAQAMRELAATME